MAEEEIGRGGRGGMRRGGRHAHGMSFGLTVALLTGCVTLGLLALGLLASGGSDKNADQAMDEIGYASVRVLASTNPKSWTAAGGDPVAHARRVFLDLFGASGRTYWDQRTEYIDRAFDEDMEEEEKNELKEAKKQYANGEDKWEKGGGTTTVEKDARKTVSDLVTKRRAGSSFPIVGAWIREIKGSKEGEIIASYPAAKDIKYDSSVFSSSTAKMKGTIRIGGMAHDVTIYTANLRKAPGGSPLRAYVALCEDPSVTGSGGAGTGSLGLILVILGPFVVGGVAWAVASAHTKNVRNLAREIDRLGTVGDPSRALRTSGGEAASVGRAVERMVANLEFRSRHDDADLEEIASKERKVAEEIHGALMSKNPPRLSNYEVETLYKPGFEIAGDHFEYFPIDQTHLGVILLDTNVRGLPAALVQASARSYVRAAAPGQLSPAAVLKTVNRNLAGDLPPGRHVTALYVVIDTREGKATIASAGHLPLIVYRHATGKMAKVNPEGIALGLDPGPVFDKSLQEGDIPIGVGDRIVLYTDGALNIASEFGEEFGEARFYEAVSREAPKNSQAFVNFVGGAIDQFHLNAPQNDDITISTVKRLR